MKLTLALDVSCCCCCLHVGLRCSCCLPAVRPCSAVSFPAMRPCCRLFPYALGPSGCRSYAATWPCVVWRPAKEACWHSMPAVPMLFLLLDSAAVLHVLWLLCKSAALLVVSLQHNVFSLLHENRLLTPVYSCTNILVIRPLCRVYQLQS